MPYAEVNGLSRWATSTRMPTAEDFTAKLGPVIQGFPGWSDEELAAVTARTLVLVGDHDFVTIEHAALELELIPDARLAVVPGATHNGLMHRADVVLPILEDFLARM